MGDRRLYRCQHSTPGGPPVCFDCQVSQTGLGDGLRFPPTAEVVPRDPSSDQYWQARAQNDLRQDRVLSSRAIYGTDRSIANTFQAPSLNSSNFRYPPVIDNDPAFRTVPPSRPTNTSRDAQAVRLPTNEPSQRPPSGGDQRRASTRSAQGYPFARNSQQQDPQRYWINDSQNQQPSHVPYSRITNQSPYQSRRPAQQVPLTPYRGGGIADARPRDGSVAGSYMAAGRALYRRQEGVDNPSAQDYDSDSSQFNDGDRYQRT